MSVMTIMIITKVIYTLFVALLLCDHLPTDGCVEWKFNDVLSSYERRIIGTPKKIDLFQWLSDKEQEAFNLKKIKTIMGKVEG